jgi:hypothetical protein
VRYAILFSGMSFRRHLNGLEFCYRMLVDRRGFAPENIEVLSYDGSLRSSREDAEPKPMGDWPGDQTPYRLRVSGAGSRDEFRRALRKIGRKLGPDDQLFINVTGSGGNHGMGSGPDLIVFPDCRRYRCKDFCADLASLPPHHSLLVVMAQCFAGGFNQPLLDASPALHTFVAAAANEDNPSFTLPDDLGWDSFQRNFIAGLSGHDVDGSALESTVIAAGCRPATAREAFEYAVTAPVRSPYDSPQFVAKPESAANMTLVRD